MNITEQDQLRRAVRDAVFLAERLRRAGQTLEATEVLESEAAAAQARLSAGGVSDAASVVHQWHTEAEASFALAQLISELVAGRIQSLDTPLRPAPAPRPTVAPSAPTASPLASVVPGLADLLDGMLTEERKSKRRPT